MEYPKASASVEVQGVHFTYEDVSNVINAFYQQVATDLVLKAPFGSVEDWPHHIERLTNFWWVRLGGSNYLQVAYNPPLKHLEAGFNEAFLERWLSLFGQTLTSHLKPEQASLWMSIAGSMGFALNRKNEFLKKQYALGSAPQ